MKPSAALAKRAPSLADRLVGELAAGMRSGAFRPGDKLPTEAEVVRRYGVSRTVVREALSRLQATGLVETRHGVGTFVTARRERGLAADAAEIAAVIDVMALLELRIGVESEAAALAARRRTPAQLEAMATALDQFEAALAGGADIVGPDWRFHALVAEASGNRYFSSLMASIGQRAIPRASLKLPGLQADELRAYFAAVNREHHDIYGAIARGDADGARTAMRNHIGNGRERLRQRRELSDNPKRRRST